MVSLLLGGCFSDNPSDPTITVPEKITQEKTKEITPGILGSTGEPALVGEPCNFPSQKRKFSSTSYYAGPLIDAHVHLPVFSRILSTVAIKAGFQDMPSFDAELSTEDLICLLDREGIQKIFGFVLMPNIVQAPTLEGLTSLQQKHPGKIVPFYMPTLLPGLNPVPLEVEEMMQKHPDLFQGYGEVKFDFHEIANQDPEDPQYLEAYALAEKHHLIIMMHPKKNQLDVVQRLLEKYPRVPFLVHGVSDVRDHIGELMETHQNLYYSIDADVTSLFGWEAQHVAQGPTSQEYLAYLEQNFDTQLQTSVQKWKFLIEAHPDRFLWGSDRWYRWHFDPEVGDMIEEMGRSFIGQLSPSVQEKYAYQNAERLLQIR